MVYGGIYRRDSVSRPGIGIDWASEQGRVREVDPPRRMEYSCIGGKGYFLRNLDVPTVFFSEGDEHTCVLLPVVTGENDGPDRGQEPEGNRSIDIDER